MRIVSGMYKGRAIDAPDGRGTRPTTDRVRESLFSMLYSRLGGFESQNVLDAFAGSGALGIESLSRGAKFACFFERDRKACQVVERNLGKLNVDKQQYSLRNDDVFACASRPSSIKYSLVFLDPPYATDLSLVARLVSDLRASGQLREDALVCYEHDAKADVSSLEEELASEWCLVVSKKYGKTGISVFQLK